MYIRFSDVKLECLDNHQKEVRWCMSVLQILNLATGSEWSMTNLWAKMMAGAKYCVVHNFLLFLLFYRYLAILGWQLIFTEISIFSSLSPYSLQCPRKTIFWVSRQIRCFCQTRKCGGWELPCGRFSWWGYGNVIDNVSQLHKPIWYFLVNNWPSVALST